VNTAQSLRVSEGAQFELQIQKMQFERFKIFLFQKKIKIGIWAVLAGRTETMTSVVFFQMVNYRFRSAI